MVRLLLANRLQRHKKDYFRRLFPKGFLRDILYLLLQLTRFLVWKHHLQQLAYLQVKMNKFEYMPTLSASLSHSQMAMRQNFDFYDFDKDWYPSTMLGFNLSVPVFASGMRKAKIGQSKIALDQTKNMKMDLAKGLELSVQQSRVDFNIAYEKYLNEKNNIELAQKVFDRTSVKYQNGVVSSLELTVATDQLTGVQTGYISAMVDLLTAKLKLDKALGNL